MKLFWTETAKQDLKAIRHYIATDNPTAANRWVERLRKRARNALNAPLAGREVPEFSREDIRELIEGLILLITHHPGRCPGLVCNTLFYGEEIWLPSSLTSLKKSP